MRSMTAARSIAPDAEPILSATSPRSHCRRYGASADSSAEAEGGGCEMGFQCSSSFRILSSSLGSARTKGRLA
jgi:hypothetical protein